VDKPVRPEEEGCLPLLYQSEYGLDVVVAVGEMRETEAKTFREAHHILTDRYGIEISERHVSNLYRIFLSLVHCVNADFEPLRDMLRLQGRLILSVDGVQFDGVSAVLYVVREILSGEVLYSVRVEKRDAIHLERLLLKVKALGIPVTAIVSDKEKGLLPAVERAFPGVSHQYCQSHYLGNLKKPMDEELTQLGNGVSKIVSAVKALSRKVSVLEEEQAASGATAPKYAKSEVTAEEMNLVNELCSAAVAGGKTSGDPILGPAQVRRFERLDKVRAVAEQAARKEGSEWKLLGALITILSLISGHAALAIRLLRQVEIVRGVAHILNSKATAKEVQMNLRTYLDQLAVVASGKQVDSKFASFIHRLTAVSNRYWKGLFHCYDNSDIPRTDNALEQLFSLFKRYARKITGRKSTSGGPLESYAALVLEAWSTVRLRPEYADLVNKVPREALLVARAELETLAGPARKRRSIQRDPDRHLQELLDEWFDPSATK